MPFINLEAFFLVFAMTFLVLWFSYPFGDIVKASWAAISGTELSKREACRMRAILNDAASSAIAAGAVAAVLAMMLMLCSINDVAGVPRRMALALATLFYAFVLSEFVCVPLARRLSNPTEVVESGNQGIGSSKRQFLGLLSFGIMLLMFMTIIVALSAVHYGN